MSKKKQAKVKTPIPVPIVSPPALFYFRELRLQAAIIAIIGFIFYANSFFNEYALDDGIVIHNNEYVQQGIKGISKIISTDAYDSFYRQMGAKEQLSGGRYRPLSIVTFAIEQEIIGKRSKTNASCWDENKNKQQEAHEDRNGDGLWNELDCQVKGAFLRHVVNVLFYVGSAILLLYFLRRYLLASHPNVAFLTALLFVAHPIHTEVVANVKSRDELLSFLFIVLTLIYSFRYLKEKSNKTLVQALLCFFLALLSKEYAITLLVLIPVMYHVSGSERFGKNVGRAWPFFIVAILYLFIRFSIVVIKADVANTEVLNNPYLFASKSEKWATVMYTLTLYLKLLLFPHPLSADYSYNQIPYKTFGDAEVWLSLGIHLFFIIAALLLLKRRHVLAFALIFYLLNLFLVGNILMDIGATMGERLVYHSSFGYVLIIAWILVKAVEKLKIQIKAKRLALMAFLAVVIVLYGFKTIERNATWKNDITLFIEDVNTVPNSVLANGNAGARYIDLSEWPVNKGREKKLLDKAVIHLNKAVHLHPKYVNGYLNLGLAYFKLGHYDKAEENWARAKTIYPNNPYLKTYYTILATTYLNKALELGSKGQYTGAIQYMQKACAADPNNAEMWYNLGGAYYSSQQYASAKEAWTKALELKPGHQEAQRGLAALASQRK